MTRPHFYSLQYCFLLIRARKIGTRSFLIQSRKQHKNTDIRDLKTALNVLINANVDVRTRLQAKDLDVQ
jgi:hypothetical protein